MRMVEKVEICWLLWPGSVSSGLGFIKFVKSQITTAMSLGLLAYLEVKLYSSCTSEIMFGLRFYMYYLVMLSIAKVI